MGTVRLGGEVKITLRQATEFVSPDLDFALAPGDVEIRMLPFLLSDVGNLVAKRHRVGEQKGSDRAEYGTRLLENLSSRLVETGMDRVAPRSLRHKVNST